MKTFKGKSMKPGGGGRFAKVEAEAAAHGARNPAAVAAAAGRKKYGAEKMAEFSAQGRHRSAEKRHEGHSSDKLKESMVKSLGTQREMSYEK